MNIKSQSTAQDCWISNAYQKPLIISGHLRPIQVQKQSDWSQKLLETVLLKSSYRVAQKECNTYDH